MSNCNHPIVLAFYLNREMLVNTELTKEYNVMAFFMPTDGDDRLECLNPIIMTEDLKAEVYPILEDIKKSFDIQEKVD
jgi:hypothetical protein